MIKRLYIIALAFVALLSSCKNDEPDDKTPFLKSTLEYDIVLPENILKLANAYAIYEEDGDMVKEKIQYGHFKRSVNFDLEGDEVNGTYRNFDGVKIVFELKQPDTELNNSVQLLKDSSAYARSRIVYKMMTVEGYEIQSLDGWTTAYKFTDRTQELYFSPSEQREFFDQQNQLPYLHIYYDLIRERFTYHYDFEVVKNNIRVEQIYD